MLRRKTCGFLLLPVGSQLSKPCLLLKCLSLFSVQTFCRWLENSLKGLPKETTGGAVTVIHPCAAWTMICWACEALDVDKGSEQQGSSGRKGGSGGGPRSQPHGGHVARTWSSLPEKDPVH